VGTAAIQLVRRVGATAIATTRSPRKLGALITLGAALTIDTSEKDFAAEIEGALGPNAVHVILDPVGGAFFERNLRVLARGGRLVLIASMAGGSSTIDLRTVLMKRLRIVGSTLRSRPVEEKITLTQGFLREVLPGFSDGSLTAVVDSVIPLARAADAFRRMAANENVGKIVLTVE
jgi:NADPH2:quinone reductase